MIMMMVVPTGVMMLVPSIIAPQNKNTKAIYNEPKYRHKNGLIEYNLHRIEHSHNALESHKDGKDGQQHRARKSA